MKGRAISPTTKDAKALSAEKSQGQVVGDGRVHKDASAASFSKDGEAIGEEMECQPCEAAPVRIARNPGDPTAQELEDHCVCHCPYRSWCPVCVKAKGKEEAHRTIKGDRSSKPTISMDYKAFGQGIEFDDKATAIIWKED